MAQSETSPAALSTEEKARRSGSFGSAADLYQRYRPGPSVEAVDWLLADRTGTVVDLGAGTGALSRLLVDRVDRVIAVEPDDRMRAAFTREVPGVEALSGRAESMPLADSSVDVVVASASWHWVDPPAALAEVARVLRPGGVLGAVWAVADPKDPLIGDTLQEMLAASSEHSAFSRALARNAPSAADLSLTIPRGLPFDAPEQQFFTWAVPMTLDDLVGLIGTFSWMLVLSEGERTEVLDDARTMMGRALGIGGDQTVELGFGADAYRTRCHA